MSQIPTHTRTEKWQGEYAFIKHISESNHIPAVNYAHRDDYYLFIFIEGGHGKLAVDFEEYALSGSSVCCILPGRVHFPVGSISGSGWVLGVDSMLVKEEYKDIFERSLPVAGIADIEGEQLEGLRFCISTIEKRLEAANRCVDDGVTRDLLSYCIGTVAEILQKDHQHPAQSRHASITHQFKKMLSANYKEFKSPSQFASALNISPAYLNETVKKTTGHTVTECIQNEVVVQAQRLLFYTEMSVKEIAEELGYEDWAYFTRIFTKVAHCSPTQFRKRYRP